MGVLILRLQAYAGLSAEDVAAIEATASKAPRDVAIRRDIVREGDVGRSVFLVLEGWACRYKTLPDGRRQIVAFLIPGDLCNLDNHVLGRADHAVGAVARLKLSEIGRDEFDSLLGAHPRIAKALWRNELVAAAIQREWTLNVGQRSAIERIAHLLCEIHERLAVVGLAASGRCELPLTQVDLAEATGLTPVHVNRTLQELRRMELIELANKRLHVPDMAALRKAALFNDTYLHLDAAPGEAAAA